MAAQRISASRQRSGRSTVFEWATVTVQLAASSNCASGLPTRIERPTTSARLPAMSPSVSRSMIMQPSGVQGVSAGRLLASRPALVTVRPSTSLSGSSTASTRASLMCLGSGSCTKTPWMAGSAFSSRTSAIRVASVVSAGRRLVTECKPAARLSSPLLRT